MKVNVACVQMQPKRFDVETNLSKMQGFIEQIMEEKPKTELIVFPELITSGYECGKEFQNLAETVPHGQSMKIIGELAKKYQVHIVYGFPERDPYVTDVLYNSAALIDSNGEVMGVYRKVHPFDTEKQYFRAGCGYPLFNTPIGKIGIMICWDTAFPEVARSYALQGADLIVISTNWEKPYEADWDLITKARAFDNVIYIAAANRIGHDETLGFFGRSKIMGPLGVPIAELNEEVEGVISAELDYSVPLRLKHEYYTFFKDRRPDTYDLLVKRY
jgi:predicted amidohydrolase